MCVDQTLGWCLLPQILNAHHHFRHLCCKICNLWVSRSSSSSSSSSVGFVSGLQSPAAAEALTFHLPALDPSFRQDLIMRLRTAMGMRVDGDGDLGAVVWGIPSAPGLHSHHTASSSSSSSSSSASSSRGRSAEEASSFVSIRGQNHPPLSIFKESGLNYGSSQGYHFPSVPAFGGDDLFPLTKAANASTPKAGVRKPDPGETQISTHSKQISRRRKLQQKRIVYVPVSGDGRPSGETLPSDMWAWRKYGQKPIKGSPYPRGYYRCSSSKGCSARKQVERSQTDPSMLIITYTSDHNHTWPAHRNSLAGTTRPKSSIQKVGSNAVASDPPHQLSASINNPDTPSISEKTLSGQIGFLLGNHSGNLGSVSKASSHEKEFFLEFNELPEFSSALKKPFLDERSDDEGANVEVDPYNLFCWSAGGFPTS